MTRVLDIILAVFGLVLLWPVFGLAALLVLFTEGFPILFRQTRVGRNGRLFRILKFRTMKAARDGPAITARGDNRITPTGAWLRYLKIDELPQLINVICGEMSFVGPRPEVLEYVEFNDRLWRAVLLLRPGITDLASLTFRNEEAILGAVADPDAHYRSVILPEKLRLNLLYQETRSLTRDIKLLWMTGWYSLFPRGFNRDEVLRSLGA